MRSLRRLVPAAAGRCYGNAPQRVRPWEEYKQPLMMQGPRDMSTMLMICCVVMIPVFMVVVVTPTTWARREQEAQWALNLVKDREEGKPAYYTKEAADTRWERADVLNANGSGGYFSDRKLK